MILAVESSCDDTCAAVVNSEGMVLSNITSSQLAHEEFGGVVPEIASRHHLEAINWVIDKALDQAGTTLDEIEAVAVTQGPGLIGALLIGFNTAKALACSRRIPLIPVDHLHGHIAAVFLQDGEKESLETPFLCLLASGGHTMLLAVDGPRKYRLLGQTLDDAAGEAFDKGARLLGLGFPGGAELSALALNGDPHAFKFPIAARVAGYNFSFAGVKTALLYAVRDLSSDEFEQRRADLAASYEFAIVDALIHRIKRAIQEEQLDRVAICGGVAANRLLRERIFELDVDSYAPSSEFCVDNAAMIASAARFCDRISYPDYLDLDVYARSPLKVGIAA